MSEKLISNEQEAIETIKSNMPTSGYEMLRESLDMAISALEKQIPKKPKSEKERMVDNFSLEWFDYTNYYCPNCSKEMPESSRINKRCPYCGQAVDWD